MRTILVMLSMMILCTCDTAFRDRRDLPEPPELPAKIRPCPPEASILADKMNVVYVGVDNPISVDLRHANANNLELNAEGASLRRVGTNYVLSGETIGDVTLTASLDGEVISERRFRAKRIPDPVVKLSNSAGGRMGSGEFKAQGGLAAFLDNFDFEAYCKVSGFMITRIGKDGERQSNVNHGGKFGTSGSKLIQQASPGDIYTFTEVRVMCPGDQANRLLNSLAFHIK